MPLLRAVVPRQRQFAADMAVIDACLDDLITRARETRQEDDFEALQARDYSKVRGRVCVCVCCVESVSVCV